MNRYTKKYIEPIKAIKVAEPIIKKHFDRFPVTASKLMQDIETEVKREVLDILFNESNKK